MSVLYTPVICAGTHNRTIIMEENRCENETYLQLRHRKDTYVALP